MELDAEQFGIGASGVLSNVLSNLKSNVDEIHLHIDLDVLDPKEAPANEYGVQAAGGLGVAQLIEASRIHRKGTDISSATIAAFDPKFDPLGKTLRAGLE